MDGKSCGIDGVGEIGGGVGVTPTLTGGVAVTGDPHPPAMTSERTTTRLKNKIRFLIASLRIKQPEKSRIASYCFATTQCKRNRFLVKYSSFGVQSVNTL